jgi:hypothetical protein
VRAASVPGWFGHYVGRRPTKRRKGVEAMNEKRDEEKVEGERIVCRVKKSPRCYDGRPSFPIYDEEEGMSGDGTFDGRSVICDACFIAIDTPSVGPGGDPGRLAGGRGRPGADRR